MGYRDGDIPETDAEMDRIIARRAKAPATVPCACDKRDWCGCAETFDAPRLCSRCSMHQYQPHRTRIRKPAR